MEKVRIGVFGAGRGMSMVNQILSGTEGELVAVCDKYKPSLDNCRNTAEAAGMNDVAYYTDFEEFIRHDGMDAVILANYAYQHAPYAIRLLDSGRHVMSECLTCATMKEAVELIEAVERNPHLVYSYAENYCYTAVRLEMKKRYRRGDIGELMYAEGEYRHDCSPIWPQITYGQKDHWRNINPSTFYCTHSIGPILYMTGLRPVKVSGFETPNPDYMWNLGTAAGGAGMEIITLENGAILKSIHGNLKHVSPSNYEINGTRGAMRDLTDGRIEVYCEKDNENGRGSHDSYSPAPMIAEAENSGHGGADFYTTHFFIQSILGNEEAKKHTIDVYTAVDMCIPGILAYRSICNGNCSVDVPDLRNKEERDAYRSDTFCTFPDAAGDMWVPNNIHGKETPPDSVYEEVRRRFLAGEPG